MMLDKGQDDRDQIVHVGLADQSRLFYADALLGMLPW
jgi:hypothetical protein